MGEPGDDIMFEKLVERTPKAVTEPRQDVEGAVERLEAYTGYVGEAADRRLVIADWRRLKDLADQPIEIRTAELLLSNTKQITEQQAALSEALAVLGEVVEAVREYQAASIGFAHDNATGAEYDRLKASMDGLSAALTRATAVLEKKDGS